MVDSSIIIFIILLIIASTYWVILPVRSVGALWVPTYSKRVRTMLKVARVRAGDVVMDLGSGDGRIPIVAAKEFGAKGIGIEINFFLVWWARLKAFLVGARDTRIHWGDLWAADVSQADVISLFLFDWSTSKVGEKLLKECKPSVRIVTNVWRLGKGWKMVASDAENQVRVYQKKGRV